MTADEILTLLHLLAKLDREVGKDKPAHLGVLVLTMHCQRLLRAYQ